MSEFDLAAIRSAARGIVRLEELHFRLSEREGRIVAERTGRPDLTLTPKSHDKGPADPIARAAALIEQNFAAALGILRARADYAARVRAA